MTRRGGKKNFRCECLAPVCLHSVVHFYYPCRHQHHHRVVLVSFNCSASCAFLSHEISPHLVQLRNAFVLKNLDLSWTDMSNSFSLTNYSHIVWFLRNISTDKKLFNNRRQKSWATWNNNVANLKNYESRGLNVSWPILNLIINNSSSLTN